MRKRSFKMILLAIIMAGLFSVIVMLLWNALMPQIFGLMVINFWQAAGLLILARILMGGFGGGRMGRGGMMADDRNPIREKWMKMSPEERKEFIEKRRKFGFGGPFERGDFFDRAGGFGRRNREPEAENTDE